MKLRKLLWLVMALILMLQLAIVPIFPDTGDDIPVVDAGTTVSSHTEPEKAEMPDIGPIEADTADIAVDRSLSQEIPAGLIPQVSIDSMGHVRRMPLVQGDDMRTICLANEDGTNSVYVFAQPVKYTDPATGEIKVKSNALSESTLAAYALTNADNDIRTHFPHDFATKPVRLTLGDYAVEMIAVSDAMAPVVMQKTDSDTVLYPGAFGTDTAVRYDTLFGGYKEEIILYSADAATTFSFLIRCEGLEAVLADGTINYVDPNTDEVVLTTSPFYIYDSAATPNSYIEDGAILTKLADSLYQLTIQVDEAYLATEGLTYPVYVDPSLVQVTDSTVEDVTVYSGKPTTAVGPGGYNYIGYRDDEYGVGRILMRFPGLENNVVFRTLSANELKGVVLYMYLASVGETYGELRAYSFKGSTTWTDDNATWNNVGPSTYSTFLASHSLLSVNPGYITLDITKAAQNWLGYTDAAETSLDYGIIMKNTNETDARAAKCFFGDPMNPAMEPYVVFHYTPIIEDGVYYIRNEYSKKLVDIESNSKLEGADLQQYEFGDYETLKWRFTRNNVGMYVIQSLHSGLYMGVTEMSDESGLPIKQYESTFMRQTQWAVMRSESGNLILQSSAAMRLGEITSVLSLPSGTSGLTSNGTDLVQLTYTNDADYRDEWTLHRVMPTSGSEIVYEPDAWNNSTVMWQTNCYAYALNCKINPWCNETPTMQPGQTESDGDKTTYDYVIPEDCYKGKIEAYVMTDAENAGFVFELIDPYEVCPEGSYKVAFFVDEGEDYHWYRQNPDGTWSHKRGRTAVINYDASNDLILDPEAADRLYGDLDYSVLIGFYRVTPLDYIVTASE